MEMLERAGIVIELPNIEGGMDLRFSDAEGRGGTLCVTRNWKVKGRDQSPPVGGQPPLGLSNRRGVAAHRWTTMTAKNSEQF
jgi:hypothetical protein